MTPDLGDSMKYLILTAFFISTASAEHYFTTEDSHGLKKLNIHTDLEIECNMALTEAKDRLRRSSKAYVANPCMALEHEVSIEGSEKKLSKKVIASILIID